MESGLAVAQFVSAFAKATCVPSPDVAVVQFGDSTELADELVGLVLARIKRATTSLNRDFAQQNTPLPKPGDLQVVLDGEQTPRCIIRIVQVEVKAMRSVDGRFAWDEGGGDRSLAWWRSAHTRYFKRQAAREGFSLDEAAEVVLQRFEVVWPPEFADVLVHAT